MKHKISPAGMLRRGAHSACQPLPLSDKSPSAKKTKPQRRRTISAAVLFFPCVSYCVPHTKKSHGFRPGSA